MIIKLKIFIFFFCIACIAESVLAAAIRINDLRFSADSSKIRLVFDATGPVDYTIKELPHKIVVNIKHAKLIGLLNKTWLYKTPVKSVQDMQIDNNLQLILHLKQRVKLEHFALENPYRLALDLAVTNNKIAIEPIDKQQNIQRDVIIIIDPGHGGKDPGAIGYRGTREKDIALAVAKILQKAINQVKGFRAILTRNGDYFISLRERLGIAHQHKADMFIAIHADAYKYRSSHGASIFALSQKGATSEAARWLAEKENESELGQTISDKNQLLRSVLIDLAQVATIRTSLEIGETLLQKLSHISHLHSHRIEQAAFVVLKSPDIPSLLIETGFITDPYEENRLRDSKYQQKIANCIATGVIEYFIHRSPPGTYLGTKNI